MRPKMRGNALKIKPTRQKLFLARVKKDRSKVNQKIAKHLKKHMKTKAKREKESY